MHTTFFVKAIGQKSWLCMALAAASLLFAASQPAHAVVTETGSWLGSRTLSLQVGGTGGVDTVSFDVQGAALGNSLPYSGFAVGNGTPIAASSGGVTFRLFMGLPITFLGSSETSTTSVTAPASLTCTTSAACSATPIPFSSISWTVSPAPSGSTAASDLQSGTFIAGGSRTLLTTNFSTCCFFFSSGTKEIASTMNFQYANTTAYPAGTYTGTVTYTATMP